MGRMSVEFLTFSLFFLEGAGFLVVRLARLPLSPSDSTSLISSCMGSGEGNWGLRCRSGGEKREGVAEKDCCAVCE